MHRRSRTVLPEVIDAGGYTDALDLDVVELISFTITAL